MHQEIEKVPAAESDVGERSQIPMVNMDDVDIKKRSSMDDVGMKVFFS